MYVAMQWTGLKSTLADYFSAHDGVTYVVCPFIRPSLLAEILPKDQQVIVITSWRKDHLLTGVSSLDLYPLCKENDWKLFINGRLHLKLYSKDLDSAWVGSANLTGKALNDGSADNHEILHFIDELEPRDSQELQRIQNESELVNDGIYRKYKEWLDEVEPVQRPEPEDLDIGPTEEDFKTTQIPLSASPERLWEVANGKSEASKADIFAKDHDLTVFPVSTDTSLEIFMADMAEVFFRQPLVAKFASEIDEEGMYFGKIKQWLKANCTDVPIPHAKELTAPVQVIIKWFTSLDPDTYEKANPTHRDVLRRKELSPEILEMFYIEKLPSFLGGEYFYEAGEQLPLSEEVASEIKDCIGIYLKAVSDHEQATSDQVELCKTVHSHVLNLPKLTMPGHFEMSVGPDMPATGEFDFLKQGIQFGESYLEIYFTRFVDIGYGADHETKTVLSISSDGVSNVNFKDEAQVDFMLGSFGAWLKRTRRHLDGKDPISIQARKD